MPLNRKRRIFQATRTARVSQYGTALPRRRGNGHARNVVAAAAGGALTLAAAIWLFVHSSEAPARSQADIHIAAGPGEAMVLDANTIRAGDQVLRLAAISAPSRGAECKSATGETDCGVAAANGLAALVRGHSIECTITSHDRQGHPAGDCSAAGGSLNEIMVRQGWARADGPRFMQAQNEARSAERGIWR